jgi:hypothetical protein
VTISPKVLAVIAVAVALIAGIVIGVLVLGGDSGTAAASQLSLAAVKTPGTNPFMPPVGPDQAGVRPPPAAAAISPPPRSSGTCPACTAEPATSRVATPTR